MGIVVKRSIIWMKIICKNNVIRDIENSLNKGANAVKTLIIDNSK